VADIAAELEPELVVELGWTEPLEGLDAFRIPADRATVSALAGRSVLVLCDIHDGAAVDRLICEVLPLLDDSRNAVVVTGVADDRHESLDPADPSLHWHGHLVSTSPHLAMLDDFLSRNGLETTAVEGAAVFSAGAETVYAHAGARLPEVFGRFRTWEGMVEPGWFVNWIGARNRTSMQTDAQSYPVPTFQRGRRPPVTDELFEWIDILESVVESAGTFTMVELGAGYGRWLVSAVAALRQLDEDRPFQLVGVEAEPTHFKWLRRTLVDNGIDPSEHCLVRAVVAARDGRLRFQRGDPAGWYGQAIVRDDPAAKLSGPVSRMIRWSRNGVASQLAVGAGARKVRRTRAVSLASVLEPLERIDLIHVDVQGEEAEVLEAAADVLAEKVRRIHVGTHDHENEERLRLLFGHLGWERHFDYAARSQNMTPWGPVAFQDGVQSWLNPRL
jgi:FkbM family methyltransferase